MNTSDEVRRERKRRLLNQRAFRPDFVDCSCGQGCPVDPPHRLVGRARFCMGSSSEGARDLGGRH